MITDFVSTTTLQRDCKKVLNSKPFQIILQNNKPQGMILSQQATELLTESGILQQIQEEIWEYMDEETVQVITSHRKGKGKPIPLEHFRKKYGV